jgi:peptidoglycan hydrolase-like protein with peptidoglycan-binding domain
LAHKFQWVRDMGVTEGDVYDQTSAAAVEEFQKRVGLPATGIADFATCGRLGVWPPPPPRHAGLTFRGTGGIVGLDYTSRVAQEAGLEEFPISLPRIDGWHIRGGQVQPVRAGADNEASLNPTPAWRLCRPGAGGVELPRSKSQTEHHRTACRRTPPSGIGRHRQSGPSRADAAPATLRALVNDAPGVIVPSSAIEG